MAPPDVSALPDWAVIVAALAPVLAAAYAVMRGYNKGGSTPSQPSATMQVIGGALADKYATEGLTEAIWSIHRAIQDSTKEMERFRKALEDHTVEVAREHERLAADVVTAKRRAARQENQ